MTSDRKPRRIKNVKVCMVQDEYGIFFEISRSGEEKKILVVNDYLIEKYKRKYKGCIVLKVSDSLNHFIGQCDNFEILPQKLRATLPFKTRDEILRQQDDLVKIIHFDKKVFLCKQNPNEKDIYVSDYEIDDGYVAYVYVKNYEIKDDVEPRYKTQNEVENGVYSLIILEKNFGNERTSMINLGQINLEEFDEKALIDIVCSNVKYVLESGNKKLSNVERININPRGDASDAYSDAIERYKLYIELFLNASNPKITRAISAPALFRKVERIISTYTGSRMVCVTPLEKRRISSKLINKLRDSEEINPKAKGKRLSLTRKKLHS